ncbi:hypothetical protein Syncc8109_2673 [Synechococcus sp. WH 8109]|nr:hypothetical protein Syncc8109_2673 [Synechococcus sp. WH 8109]
MSDTQTDHFCHLAISKIDEVIMQKAAKKNCFSRNERSTMCDLQKANGRLPLKAQRKIVTTDTQSANSVSTHLYQI